MPIDKVGRNGDRTTTVYTGINIANLSKQFYKERWGDTAIGTIDMNSHIIKNVTDPLSNQDAATKNYADKNDITTYGGVVHGDINLKVGTDLIRGLGCNDLAAGKTSVILLVTDTNVLLYTAPYSVLPVPVKIKLMEVWPS